jgi:hypothetical protein
MQGFTITNIHEGGNLIDLVDILRLLELSISATEWEIYHVECIGGEAANELHHLSDKKVRVDGNTLLQLAANVSQVIEGVFVGYKGGQDRAWVIVKVVDSTAYDVYSEDENILTLITQNFRNVAAL